MVGNNSVHMLRQIIDDARRIVFFGGAGVSTESNIPDFRSVFGLYRKKDASLPEALARYAPEEILHKNFFVRHTDMFYQYYFARMIYPDAKPNAAHQALAAWEQAECLKAVVTQNIDGLHQQAGSQCVVELHGSVHRNICTGCGMVFPLAYLLKTQPDIPYCTACGALIKPDVVLYGESLPDYAVHNAIQYISEADTLIVGGTSLSVYPAAGLIQYFGGRSLVLINHDETPYDHKAHLVIRDNIGEVLKACLTNHGNHS